MPSPSFVYFHNLWGLQGNNQTLPHKPKANQGCYYQELNDLAGRITDLNQYRLLLCWLSLSRLSTANVKSRNVFFFFSISPPTFPYVSQQGKQSQSQHHTKHNEDGKDIIKRSKSNINDFHSIQLLPSFPFMSKEISQIRIQNFDISQAQLSYLLEPLFPLLEFPFGVALEALLTAFTPHWDLSLDLSEIKVRFYLASP